jgi:hypothetical protein
MKPHRWEDVRQKRAVEREATLTRLHDEMVEDVILHRLGELRGLARAEMIARVEAWQARRAPGERGDERLISTLRGVVAALGGRLRLQAVFEDGKVFEIAV